MGRGCGSGLPQGPAQLARIVVNEGTGLVSSHRRRKARTGRAAGVQAPWVVRRQRSQDSMNGSRSPSRTASTLPVSWPVRSSFTFW
jgi:hypothetical protein